MQSQATASRDSFNLLDDNLALLSSLPFELAFPIQSQLADAAAEPVIQALAYNPSTGQVCGAIAVEHTKAESELIATDCSSQSREDCSVGTDSGGVGNLARALELQHGSQCHFARLEAR